MFDELVIIFLLSYDVKVDHPGGENNGRLDESDDVICVGLATSNQGDLDVRFDDLRNCTWVARPQKTIDALT